MTFQVFWILFSAGCHHTNFPKINYPIISRTFDHMTISKDKLFIQLMSLSYRHIKVWLRQTRSNKYTGKNIWGHSSLRIHWGRLNNRLCLTSISLLRFNFILIDFPISKIFCNHQINNRDWFCFIFSLITTLLTIKHLVMEPFPILGNLFGANFLPDLEIQFRSKYYCF